MRIDPIQAPLLTPDDIDRLTGIDRRGQGEASRIVMQLVAEIASHSGVGEAEIRSKSRNKKLVGLRRIVIFRAREMGLSFIQIGRALRLDHSTIIHHYQVERDARHG